MGTFDQASTAKGRRARRACEIRGFSLWGKSASSARNAAPTTLRKAPKRKSGGLEKSPPDSLNDLTTLRVAPLGVAVR